MNLAKDAEVIVDLDWNDDDVVPPRVTPDLLFLFDRMIEATIDEIDPAKGSTILDIGCGRAVDAIQIARKGGSPVGLEPSKTMLSHSKRCIAESGNNIALIQGIGESLPFRDNTFDWVMCKGALDHFPDPYKVMGEISRVLKPEGKAVISIANFESLGHRLGRKVHRLTRFLPRKEPNKRQAWETPPDHTYRFDYSLIKHVLSSHMEIEEASGISFLWGAPFWDKILSIPPKRVSFFILALLDRLARHLPSLSDVVLIRCCQKSPHL
ncbi:MAG TPA: methyltransferase domain-containing protein [Dehalococcoidia bacterium]|nr:methyltransferase domain-containing protein [Dehalococcoidia bacterium]